MSRVKGHLSCLLLVLACAHPAQAIEPTYPEMADGESLFWTEGGATYWLTDRTPLAQFAPLCLAVGYGHRIDQARLAWRVQWVTDVGADAPVTFVHLEFLSVERLWSLGTVRPFGRFALGVGLDLEGEGQEIGADGYFNEDNGATAGLSMTLGTGADLMLTNRIFLRIDVAGRVHGGAGRTGLSAHLNAGAGFTY